MSMDLLSSLERDFGIKEDFVVVVSEKRFNCLVPTSWIDSNSREVPDALPSITGDLYGGVHKSLASLILARSTAKQHFDGFVPVVVNVVRKDPQIVESLVEERLCMKNPVNELSNAQVRSHVELLQRNCFQKEAREKFSNAYSAGKSKQKKLPMKSHDTIIADVIKKLYGRKPVCTEKYLQDVLMKSHSQGDLWGSGDKLIKTTEQSSKRFIASHPSLHPAYFVAETSIAFFIFQPFFRYTLADLIAFSPLKLSENSCKLFVFFEMLMAIRHLHSLGINICNLNLSDFSVNDMLWVRIISLDFSNFFRKKESLFISKSVSDALEGKNIILPKYSNIPRCTLSLKATLHDLPQILKGWINGEVSNLDYLMVINKLSGRSINEPNHHPILPWVLDFSKPSCTSFRNLTKSKYRLNKGDTQLDLTFDSTNPESVMNHPNQTPFHVSDFLSDITYYVYIARKSPRDVLCRIVRPRWQPNHYPPNIGRLYDWTPDECIPAFYTDRNIFKSCHEDLSDLQLPVWASNPREFIEVHKAALESAEISQNLHHWIDLTFGFRLTGVAAMESKNVCLQLVDKHKSLMNHGIVQLFDSPHPVRAENVSENFSTQFPFAVNETYNETDDVCFDLETSIIDEDDKKRDGSVNKERNKKEIMLEPLADLNKLETFFSFCIKETYSLDRDSGKDLYHEADEEELKSSIISRDMQTLGCLVVELFFEKIMSSLSPDHSSLLGRYSIARSLAFNRLHELPMFIRKCVVYLINLPPSKHRPLSKCDSEMGAAFTYPAINMPNDLPPPTIDLLMTSQTGVLVLPNYVSPLYQCIFTFHSLVPTDDAPHLIDPQGIHPLLNFMKRFFELECNRYNTVIYEIVFPYAEFLLTGSLGSEVLVTAAWNLFYYLGKCCSETKQMKSMVCHMTNLFRMEETKPAFLKVYHRSFISQMIMIFKLKVFLQNFSTLLVEAVSGFKNFSVSEDDSRNNPNTHIVEIELLEENAENENFVDETDKFDGDVDILLDENDGDLDDTKSIKSGCPSTNSFEDEEYSTKSDVVHQFSNDTSNADNPSCDEDCSLTTKDDHGTSKVQDALPQHPLDVDGSTSSNVSDMARDTAKWLSSKIGPVLTAKYISRNLMRMLVICYIPPLQLEPIIPSTSLGFQACATEKYVRGDLNAIAIADCLLHISNLYGEQVILIQYLQHIKELIASVLSCKTLTPKKEGYIISSITLLLIILPHMSITSLIDSLQVLENDILFPILHLLSSGDVIFSTTSPSSRSFVAFRVVDIAALISIKLGFEMTRCKIMQLIKKFFDGFQIVEKVFAEGNFQKNLEEVPASEAKHSEAVTHRRQQSLDAIFKDGGDASQQQDDGKELSDLHSNIEKQLHGTYTCELAHVAYVTFCKLAGGICIEQHLDNDDLLRKMCSNYDASVFLMSQNRTSTSGITDSRGSFIGISDNSMKDDISVEGNKIVIKPSLFKQQDSSSLLMQTLQTNDDEVIADDSQKRILRGDWLAYWEHEVGFGDRQHALDFKQIKLQTFRGHLSGARCMVAMDCENSFVSAGKDHMVKLWTIRNQGDGSAIIPCEATYNGHKKSIFSLLYIDSLKQIASSDGNVHIWDPFNMANIRRVSLKSSPIAVLACPPSPSSLLLASCNDSVVRLIDCRVGRLSHYLKTTVIPSAGHIRSMSVSDDGHYMAVGFSTGIITTLDIRTGGYVSSWKAYDSDILEMKILENNSILAFSLDLGANIWSFPNGKQLFPLKGMFEGAKWMNYLDHTLVFGYASNRIAVSSHFDASKRQGDIVNIKLKSDLIKGSLSCLSLLPLSHLFLLASDHGDIILAA